MEIRILCHTKRSRLSSIGRPSSITVSSAAVYVISIMSITNARQVPQTSYSSTPTRSSHQIHHSQISMAQASVIQS